MKFTEEQYDGIRDVVINLKDSIERAKLSIDEMRELCDHPPEYQTIDTSDNPVMPGKQYPRDRYDVAKCKICGIVSITNERIVQNADEDPEFF